MFEENVWDVKDYLKYIGECDENLTVDEFEALNTDYWTYPLNEVLHIIENEVSVVLVKFPNIYGGFDYRWCELPEKKY